ncbi:MAG: hypothetical protein A3K18_14160 [Lentisphaerae bacterium RIFOXYA12_64_32]|nr:MAG: hypothetical protein A3K18_14160 [Lentisphaerae bacterium RIFOXYA12_64_32]
MRMNTGLAQLGLTCCLFATLAPCPAQSATYYVAPGGSDANTGLGAKDTETLKTIQAAVDKAQPGETILVRGGTYRETVVFPRSGAADKPITVKPYKDEKVVVTGCDPVSGWTVHDAAKGIWKAPMPWTLGLGRNQVFVNGAVMIEARHPNTPAPGLEMYVSGLSPLWPTFGEFSIPKETGKEQPGRIVSKLLDGQPDDYWKGACYYGVHYEGWSSQTGVIESSKAGEFMVGDRTRTWWFTGKHAGIEDGRGMIVGHMNALDQPGEWHRQDNTLYLIPPAGVDPATAAVDAKKRQLAFDLSGREHIRISGLDIHAASMRLQDAAYCVVDGCRLDYISHFTRFYDIGQIENGRDTIKSGETGIFIGGHDNAFLNCSVRISAGTGFYVRGYHHTIHNCLIDEVSYTSHYLNAITDAVSDFNDYENFLVGGHVITFNTMRNAGRHFFNFYGNGPSTASRDRGPMDYMATLLAHNHLYNGMLQTRDAGFLTSYYASGGTLDDLRSQVAYNVLHDCYDIAGIRWGVIGMIYLDNGSRDVDVHHNLLWAAPGSHQRALWFNPPNTNIGHHDNVFHGLFTRTCAELTPDDFPNGKPFRFGHDFEDPPPLPQWPQLDSSPIGAESCTVQPGGVAKIATGLTNLKDGDSFSLGDIDFGQGWQSIVMRFASDVKEMNTDRSQRAGPRHLKATDPLALEARDRNGGEGLTQVWTVFRAANGGWMRFDKVPLGDGYRRFRAIYGTTSALPRRIEVHLDAKDGPLVGTAPLEQTDIPRRGSIQTFKEAVGDITDTATGTRDVYFVFVSDDGKPVAEFEYFRFERCRGRIELQKNDVRLELRLGSKDGERIGEFFPRCTGGDAEFRQMVAKLEPAQGLQPLFVVVRSALPGPIGAIAGFSLQKAHQPVDWTGIGIEPRRRMLGLGGYVFPEPTNRPCAKPADQYAQATASRPSCRATRLASRPVLDGDLSEWTGRALPLTQSLEGGAFPESPSLVWFGYDDEALYVAAKNPLGGAKPGNVASHRWRDTDAMEIVLQDAGATPPGPIISLHGWPDGYCRSPEQAGVPADVARRLGAAVTYKAAVGADAWTCEWRIPFAACAFTPRTAPMLACNLSVRNAARNTWRIWSIAGGDTCDTANGGTVVFAADSAALLDSVRNGLEVWLDAADADTVEKDEAGKVSAWKDKSGKGRNATQAAPEFRPLYSADGLGGRPALKFDDTAQTRLELPDLSDQKITATIFAAFSNPEPGLPANQHPRLFTASNGKEYDYLIGLCANIPGAETGGPRLMVTECKDRWAQNVRVGCFSPMYQTFLKGCISEILVYNRALTRAEQDKVRIYLISKWDLW